MKVFAKYKTDYRPMHRIWSVILSDYDIIGLLERSVGGFTNVLLYSYDYALHYICTQVITDLHTITIRNINYNVLRQATLLGRKRVSCEMYIAQ